LFRELLKDFPFRKWLDAADCCEFCGARYQVRVTYVDESGCFGDVEYRISHAEDCAERFDEETGEELKPAEFTFDVAGWEFVDKPVTILSKQFLPLKARANIGPCLECGKTIGIPLILFIDEGRGGELDFCQKCFEQLGLLNQLKPNVEVKVSSWEYTKPSWVPEGATEYVHPCGCRDVLKDCVWYAEQCPKHKAETNALIQRLQKTSKTTGGKTFE